MRRRPSAGASGLTLLELIAAITIAGLVSLAALLTMRIGIRAWQKGEAEVLRLRRGTSAEDIVHMQLSNYLVRPVLVGTFNSQRKIPFFFAEEHRLVFLSSCSALEHGRGGLVVADYFAELQPDQTWTLRLDERPVLDNASLAAWVADIVPEEGTGQRPVLRPFDSEHSLLLWEGLRECRFQYRKTTPSGVEWVSRWSPVASADLPSAVFVELGVTPSGWKGLEPVSLLVPLTLPALPRKVLE